MVKGLKVMFCEERLRTLRLSILEKRRPGGVLSALWNVLRESGKRGASLFSLVTDERMHRNSTKQSQGRFWLDIRNNLFAMSLVKSWNRHTRQVFE